MVLEKAETVIPSYYIEAVGGDELHMWNYSTVNFAENNHHVRISLNQSFIVNLTNTYSFKDAETSKIPWNFVCLDTEISSERSPLVSRQAGATGQIICLS